jgi:hypothetical protein
MSAAYIRARSGVNVLITPSTTVRDDRISYRAAGVLSRLLDNVEGFGMTAEQLAKGKAREGRDAVRTALRELEAAGYIRRRANKQPDGSFKGWTMYVYDTPATATGKPENPLAEFPAAEKPAHKSSKSITGVKASIEQQHCTQSPAADSAAAKVKGEKRKRHHPLTGVVYWYEDEVAEIDLLVTIYGLESVQAAVATLASGGKDPLPGRVAKELQRQQRAAVEAEAIRHRKATQQKADAAENDPVRKARVEEAKHKAIRESGLEHLLR